MLLGEGPSPLPGSLSQWVPFRRGAGEHSFVCYGASRVLAPSVWACSGVSVWTGLPSVALLGSSLSTGFLAAMGTVILRTTITTPLDSEPGPVLSTLHPLSHLIPATLRGQCECGSHFTDRQTAAQLEQPVEVAQAAGGGGR